MKSFKSIDKWGHIRYKNIRGVLHREDGPARVWPDGSEWYYLNGKWYTKEKWKEEVIKLKLMRLKDL
jgi:hypothetical protein